MVRAVEKKAVVAKLVHSGAKCSAVLGIVTTATIEYVILVENSESPILKCL
jgi:hypothetical protein